MTDLELRIYNGASRACVADDRLALARWLRASRRHGEVETYRWGRLPLAKACVWHASYIGWPARKRPNGRFI